MRFLFTEKISDHKYKTPEGYLVCVDAVLARTGKQEYMRDEIFHDGDDTLVSVDRPEKEVFSPEALASFENKPICILHPDEDVNAGNVREYCVGFVRDVKRGTDNGTDVMLGTLVLMDEEAIREVEGGTYTDLSCGYDCDIGEDLIQRNIRGNHIALCEAGRAGCARIIDSAPAAKNAGAGEAKDEKRGKDAMKWYDLTYTAQDGAERVAIVRAESAKEAKVKWVKAHPELDIVMVSESGELEAKNEMAEGAAYVDKKKAPEAGKDGKATEDAAVTSYAARVKFVEGNHNDAPVRSWTTVDRINQWLAMHDKMAREENGGKGGYDKCYIDFLFTIDGKKYVVHGARFDLGDGYGEKRVTASDVAEARRRAEKAAEGKETPYGVKRLDALKKCIDALKIINKIKR